MQLNELSAFQNVPVIFWFKKHNHSNCDCVMMTKIEYSLVLNPGPAEIIFALEPQRTRRWARHMYQDKIPYCLKENGKFSRGKRND